MASEKKAAKAIKEKKVAIFEQKNRRPKNETGEL